MGFYAFENSLGFLGVVPEIGIEGERLFDFYLLNSVLDVKDTSSERLPFRILF